MLLLLAECSTKLLQIWIKYAMLVDEGKGEAEAGESVLKRVQIAEGGR